MSSADSPSVVLQFDTSGQMATRARLGKAAAAAAAGAEKMLLTPRKIFGGGQGAVTELDSEALPQATGLRARDETPLSTEPQARMSSDDKESTSAIMLQLQLMQGEQKKGMHQQQTMQQRMDERFDELRDEMQREREERCKEMQQLRSEQSTIKAQA